MSHPDLPPEQPLSEATRARIRARLLDATGEQPGSGHRWLLPIVAAVAVLVIAAATGYAALRPGDDPDSVAPAGQGSAEPTPVDTPSPGGVDAPSDAPTDIPTESPTIPATPSPGGETCAGALPGKVVASWPSSKGTTSIFSDGSTSQLCDDSGGIVTTHRAQPLDATLSTFRSVDGLRVSTSVISADPRQLVTVFVAGGQLPEAVTGIEYLFPDGHAERARISRDGDRAWWGMSYTAYDGVLADPDTNQLELDPIQVIVSLSGAQPDYTLHWVMDTCAQVNHGC